MGSGVKKQALDPAERHLQWELLLQRIEAGPPSIEPVTGSPSAQFFVEPGGSRIGLRFFSKAVDIPTSPLAEIQIEITGDESVTAIEISTGNRSLYQDFYSICCVIADRVQLDQLGIGKAISRTLKSLSALLKKRNLLSAESEIGLIGELTFLRLVAKQTSWTTAEKCWNGPDSEEHDFALPSGDFEIKSTTREERIHSISNPAQLVAKAKRPLFLASLQFTSAGAGKEAFTLSELVKRVLFESAAFPGSVKGIREKLGLVGWNDEDASSYIRRFLPRSEIMLVRINPNFPAITPARLKRVVGASATRLSEISYSVNVEGLGVLESKPEFRKILLGAIGKKT
jgi:hypothetical protein